MFDKQQLAYTALRNIVAERTSPILFWIGSGLSATAGIPTWSKMRDMLCDALESKTKTLDPCEAAEIDFAIQSARETQDFWNAFSVLKDKLGETTYRAEIRRIIQPKDVRIPTTYTDLWELRPHGVLNLNLDRLATRALSVVRKEACPIEFSGFSASNFLHVMSATTPFVANLHGTWEDHSTWVFTKSNLNNLFKDEGYTTLVSTCLTAYTVVFIGISADDIAAGGHLHRLSRNGLDLGTHFWITSRNDVATDRWAESAGIRVIRYNPIDLHSELNELLLDLRTYTPVEESVNPVKPLSTKSFQKPIPKPTELLPLPATDIRDILNSEAAKILAEDSSLTFDNYERFCKEYAEPIYRAWYINPESSNNKLFKYRLIEQEAEGAFGQVFRGEDDNGKQVAIKILREEVRRKPDMLQAFRRGVRAMQILQNKNINGMVPYCDASEIPACVVMEFVEGPNLLQAVENRWITEWHEILRISFELSCTIRGGHLLPERVLHRDIRPSNVMLKNYHTSPENWSVVVLDFDLSWHRDAVGMSIDNATSMNGFLAPEQLYSRPRESARNALVDSFGLGMTLYYLRSGREPRLSEQNFGDWRNTLTYRIAGHQCPEWKSIPRRFARLIEWSTRDKQSERWDMAQIQAEIYRLQQAQFSPNNVESAELLTEELAARSTVLFNNYRWNKDLLVAEHVMPSGVTTRIKVGKPSDHIALEITWTNQGHQKRRKIGKWIGPACDKAFKSLDQSGWLAKIVGKETNHACIEASYSTTKLTNNLNNAATSLDKAISAFDFS